jgi:hypothetical protein
MTYNTQTQITIVNNFNDPINIILKHQYSDDSLFSNRWLNIPPGAQATTDWTVGYQTGFGHFGQDYWFLQAEAQSGEQTGVWRVETFPCTLHKEDASRMLCISVSPDGLILEKPSGASKQAITKIA